MRNYRALFTFLALLLTALAGLAQVPLRLAPDAAVLDTAGYLQRLDDSSGMLGASDADTAPGWTPLPGSLNASYTSSAIWLRLRLEAVQPGPWTLLLGNALLDDVRVHIRPPGAASEQWALLGASGEDVPRRLWPVDYRSPALQIDLPAPGTYTVLVRLATRNALTTRLEVWQRLAFDNHTRREGLFFGLYFGFYLLLICLHVLFWRVTRAPLSGWFVAYLGSCVFNEVLSLGLIQQIMGLGGIASDRLLGASLPLALPIAVQMALRQLQLEGSYPRVARMLGAAAWGLGLTGAALAQAGYYAWGVAPVQAATLPMALLLFVLAVTLLRRGLPRAGFFLVVFGLFHASVLVAFMRNLGFLPVNAFTEHISAMGTMVHMVLLSLWIVGGYERQRRARERQQIQLEAELAQRQHREGELLQALELERRVYQEQRDFVAMVSHEFRTPLAVITTSAQQLGRNLNAPPEKTLARSQHIRAAAQRLLALVDDCLADDRMAGPHAPDRSPHTAACDLHVLIDELRQDFAPGRIQCTHGADTRHLATDAALLRIALRNLLANADHHAPREAAVRIDTALNGTRLHIDVSNPAPAIQPEEQARLFERYWRGSGAQHRPGAGLGLYLVRRIAEKLGGSVTLRTAGGGEPVCLRLELPRL